ncbi:TPA_asm: UL18 uoORF [Human alphaherpesvirus 1]|nr:TPA_asm: UL18 uoORF [Human alphaherpesvirus 1]
MRGWSPVSATPLTPTALLPPPEPPLHSLPRGSAPCWRTALKLTSRYPRASRAPMRRRCSAAKGGWYSCRPSAGN